MAPRCIGALKAARLEDALYPDPRSARGFVRKLHLNWGHSAALRLQRILVDSEIASNPAPEIEGCIEGCPIFARPLRRPSIFRSMGGRWFLFFARRPALTPYPWTTSAPCTPWANAPGTPLCCDPPRTIPVRYGAHSRTLGSRSTVRSWDFGRAEAERGSMKPGRTLVWDLALAPSTIVLGSNPRRIDRVDGLVRAFFYRLLADGRFSGRGISNEV